MQIKLLGDSITHGVGGTGFIQDGEPIVENFARNPNGYCWANRFRDYMKSQFNCTVINNACSGTTIEFIIKHFDTLVDKDDDLILCTIGTNNRRQYFHAVPRHTKQEHMDEFYQNILVLYEKFKKANKKVIFVANIPASAENEKDGENYWRLFHMDDVLALYEKAAEECGFPLIRLYTLFMEYCNQKNITVDSLLTDGLHPNDAGHDVIYDLLIEALEITIADIQTA